MRCIRCKKDLPPDAVYCPYCGRRQSGPPTKKSRYKKRPNGAGSVVKLSGHRANPFRATLGTTYLGVFATEDAARQAIVNAKANSKMLPYARYTMADVYAALCDSRAWIQKTEKYRRDTGYSWNYMAELHPMLAADVTFEDLQAVIYRAQDENKSRSHQQKLRVLMKKLCLWCQQHGLHPTDYSDGLSIDSNVKSERHAFTDDDLSRIYAHRFERAAGIVWFLCATGCRPVDLTKIKKDDRIDLDAHGIWLAGSKSVAGKNRYISIDPITWPVFKRFYDNTQDDDFVFRSRSGKQLDCTAFLKKEFYPLLAKLEIQPLPTVGQQPRYVLYCCRHTFATLAERSGVDKAALQRAMGHSIGSAVTDDYYIDQDAHVKKAAIEFSKLAAELESVTKIVTNGH